MLRRLVAALGGALAELLTRIMFMGLSLIAGFWIFNQVKGGLWNGIDKKTTPINIPSINNASDSRSIIDNGLNELQKLGKTPLISIPKTRDQVSRENGAIAYFQVQSQIADFKAHYKKPEICYNMPDHKTRVFCANHFMRAKKEWDKAQGTKVN